MDCPDRLQLLSMILSDILTNMTLLRLLKRNWGAAQHIFFRIT